MAHCYNCGIDIADDDKTRLCNECKKILLPFVKFMDASTSSAVRRLVSNENNLRNVGVTDSGMEYLLRICELHDKKKAQGGYYEDQTEVIPEVTEDEYGAEEKFNSPAPAPTAEDRPVGQYTDIEIPLDRPLNLIRRSYGQYLAAVEIVFGVIAALAVVWFMLNLLKWSKVDFTAVVAALISGVSIYVTDSVRRMIYDIEELKKHFR